MKPRPMMGQLILVLALLFLAYLPRDSLAVAPFVAFADVVRESDCIYVADYSTPSSAAGKADQDRSYQFAPTAIVGGRNCSATAITVFRTSDESPITLTDGAYVLFLTRRDGNTFLYTREPFSILRVKDGQVGTAPFRELGEKVPLDKMLTRIRLERGR